MPRRLVCLLLLPLLLLAVGATWLTLASGGDAAGDDVGGPADIRAALAPAQLQAAAAETADDPEQHDLGSGDGPLRQEVIDYPTDADGPVLRVVAAATHQPVPFAEVFVGEANAEWRTRRGGARHWAEILEADTPARRADAQGEVRLPAVRRRLLVAGRAAAGPSAPALFGVMSLRAGDAQPVLELVPDVTLKVRVLDGSGVPARDVPVGLCADLRERWQPLSRARSDAEGLAIVRHVQLFEMRVPPQDPGAADAQRVATLEMQQARAVLDQIRLQANGRLQDDERLQARVREVLVHLQESRQRRGQASRQLEQLRGQNEQLRRRGAPETQTWPIADFVVHAQVPQGQPSCLRFPAQAVPAGIVDLRLPATSALVVRVLGPEGKPLRSPCSVVLRLAGGSLAAGAAPANFDDLCELRADKVAGDAAAVFAPVGLGLRFDLLVRLADNDFDFQQQGVPGPLTTEPREVVLYTPPWFSVLAGRFVDGDGNGIADVDAQLFVAGAAGRVEGEQLRLEPDGRFELPVRVRQPAPPYTLEVSARIGERHFGRLVPVPDLVNGKRTEVGDVVVAELPVLAFGTVRDDLGQPLPRADVVLHVLRGERWTEESFVRDRTDEQGNYTLRAEPRPLRLQLQASLRRHASEVRPFTFGERVDVVLPRNGAILAEGIVPAFVPREAVVATLVEADGGRPRDVQLRPRPNEGFQLRIDDLRPGAFDLTLRVRGLPRPLAIAARVLVRPGETVRPDAIDGLDLRGRLFEYQVRAVDQAGQAMGDPGSPLLVELHDGNGSPTLVPFAWRGGNVRLITDQPSVNAVALAPGHRPTRSLLQPGENTLRLTRLHPVRLQLPGLRAMLGQGQAGRISLVYAGDTGILGVDVQGIDQWSGRNRGYARAQLGKAGGAPLGDDDLVSVSLMFNGRYEIVLRVDGPGGRVSKTIGFVDVVLDGPAPMTATVAPNAAAVQDAMAELRARPPRK